VLGAEARWGRLGCIDRLAANADAAGVLGPTKERCLAARGLLAQRARASMNRVTSRNDASASRPIGCHPTSSSSSLAIGSPNTLFPSLRKNRVLNRRKEWDGVIARPT